jgi:hypothetical protein
MTDTPAQAVADLEQTLADERAWAGAEVELMVAAKESVHAGALLPRLRDAVAAVESLERAAAERIAAERKRQERL